MPTEIKMPQLGESVVEGTIGKWLKQPGDHVGEYEALLEVMTDKVDSEVPAPSAGILREILVPEGETVSVGTLIAILDTADEAQTVVPATATTPQVVANNNQPRQMNRTATTGAPTISPVVARLVAEHNLDVSEISGTGQGGRVSKQDVLKFIEQQAQRAKQPASIPTAPPPIPSRPVAPSVTPPTVEIPEDAELVPISPMRRIIAEHMVRSRNIAPHVTTVAEVDLSKIVAHRKRHKVDFERQNVKLTFTPYFVQASVAALQAVPVLNGSYTDEGIVLNHRINIGIAVALDEGLIVPVLRDADEKNLLGLSRAVNDLSERARTRRLKPDDTQGGTFTISNHGVSGSLFATPIINQPQSGILGVGAIEKRAVVITQDGVDAIAVRTMCYISLTFDHRITDGAMGDLFLMTIKKYLETYSEG
ncbi:MAG: 2-oxo acid dehydrogenase subunit E2 [Chloroflexi bacterium AL-W]|nr:2-oxo acid dehydrogenase subunit E2 [Chloroflexi bacterium AL-N1]NOK68711.1 2-oxo acid dehydrogenase subunit E2 [Chloroflexi bacterium AL-N10]NOK76197.1 2-oxo acid dehydrogenase subunit E2 [Chloroflexi bacterium AL-N5]NOK84166.1 2-oxo acid dehydrogenase subunit E2 [Chloroflexi bacterium AL-W]NOK91335.1 2-oxo acid dehydrogenase subunit E2 [Chloroflexi bacterium AL-N15]